MFNMAFCLNFVDIIHPLSFVEFVIFQMNIQIPMFDVEAPVENSSCSRLSDNFLLTNVDFMTKAKRYSYILNLHLRSFYWE